MPIVNQPFGGAFDIESILPKLQSKTPEELQAIGQRMDADGVPVPPGISPQAGALNVPGLQNAPMAPPAQPELPGLQGAISPTYDGLKEQNAGQPQGGNTWQQLLSDPETLLQMGASLLQPRQAGQSDLGNAVSGLASGVSRLSSKRQERSAAEAAGKEAESKQALRGAQGEQITSQTSALNEDRGLDQDFKQAKIDLTRAQADAAKGKGGAGAAKQIQDNAMINAMWKTRPDKYATVDEARVAWETFKQTKGRDPLFEAVLENIWLAPKEDRTRLMDGMFKAMDTSALGEPAAGPSGGRLPEVDKIPAEKWLSLEGVNAKDRAEAEAVFGKDTVARKIAEAKGIR